MKLLEPGLEHFQRKVKMTLHLKRNTLWGLGGGPDLDNLIPGPPSGKIIENSSETWWVRAWSTEDKRMWGMDEDLWQVELLGKRVQTKWESCVYWLGRKWKEESKRYKLMDLPKKQNKNKNFKTHID